ncbi:MAG: WecB/TagA/CpsF family glycosyltransferase [Pseudomonadota bacterium]
MQHNSSGWDQATEVNTWVRPRRQVFLGVPFDPLTPDETLTLLRDRTPGSGFGYVATPNVQHVVSADRDPDLTRLLDGAWLSLCDSRPIRLLGKRSGLTLPVVTGSDLTTALFADIIQPGDRIAVICASDTLAEALRTARPELDWNILVPPPGTVPGSQAFADCVDFVAHADARFIFVCLGAPKSEAICHAASQRPGTTGTALCTGASLEFMLGLKKRAPRAFQRLGLEWVHRMLTEPRRLARRYLSAMLPLARIWLREPRRSAEA